jgi:hypothetical protein
MAQRGSAAEPVAVLLDKDASLLAALLPFDLSEHGLASLSHWLRQEEVTIYNSAMPLFRQLAHTLTADNPLPQLRMIKWGGETLHRRDIDLYRQYFPADCKFYIALDDVATTFCGVFCAFSGRITKA